MKTYGMATLSYVGDVPKILRAIADQIESGGASVESFNWNMTSESIEFGAVLNTKGDVRG